jgi:hypothetical protein
MTGQDENGRPDNRKLAMVIFLAWLVPGLGHVMLRRTGRGLLFAGLVFVSLGLGLAHGGKLALRDPAQPFLTSLQVVANIGIGPVDFIARKKVYGEVALTLPRRGTDPDRVRRVSIQRARATSGLSIYGTAYLWTAGIFNLLLLFDVWDIGRGRKW